MLLAKASGIISLEGLVPAVLAMARMMGSSRATVPVLLTKPATTAVTVTTRKKSFSSLLPASRSSFPLMILASPVWKTAPPTMKSPIIITTALFENPASASEGVSTLNTSRVAMEQRATMSERILPMTKATAVRTKVTTVTVACASGVARISERCESVSISLLRFQFSVRI